MRTPFHRFIAPHLRGRAAIAALLAAGAALLVVPLAEGDPPNPHVKGTPRVEGEPVVGATLTARGGSATGDPEPTTLYVWLRCDADRDDCGAVARGDSYALGGDDVGKRVGVAFVATNPAGTAFRRSRLTRVVRRAAPAPEPAPVETPAPTATPAPTPQPTPTPRPRATPTPRPRATPTPRPRPRAAPAPAPGAPPVAAPPAAPTPAPSPPSFEVTPAPTPEVPAAPGVAPAAGPPRLEPFPVVRMKGKLARRGVRITLLSVAAPPRVRIEVRCRGRGCPRSKLSRPARPLTRLRPFERYLRSGVTLSVRVTRPGVVGKHTLIAIRGGRVPQRRDRCLVGTASRPVDCAPR